MKRKQDGWSMRVAAAMFAVIRAWAVAPWRRRLTETKWRKSAAIGGGWRTMPFILGNEVCDKLATIGLLFSMILYLTQEFHLSSVAAANLLAINNATSYLTPIVGGYLADAHYGRFLTLLISSALNLLGMLLLLLTAAVRSLRPAACLTNLATISSYINCPHPTPRQLLLLYTSFAILAIAAGGIRPCAYPFGADQFPQNTPSGKQAFQTYSNWYFFGIYLAVLLSGTLVVYVQESVGWAMGFAIPAIAAVVSIAFFVSGTPFYRHEIPAGSPLKELAMVCCAAFRKRKLPAPTPASVHSLYDPPAVAVAVATEKYLHTHQFLFLDKAAVIQDGELGGDGELLKPWRLCTVQQVEQAKLIIRILPIMVACMLHAMAVSQQTSFSVLQANTMERRLFGSSSFKLPAASTGVIPMITIMMVLPFYDKVVLPLARKITGTERGITFLQRIGAGYAMAICAMLLSGVVENRRRAVARRSGLADLPAQPVPMSVLWLMPQLCLMGVGEAFTGVGQAEFFYDQVPEGMRSTAGSINSAISGVGVYVSAVILTTVERSTAAHGRVSWLDDNLNKAHLDRYYYIVAGLIGVNLVYFLVVSNWYSYKSAVLVVASGGSRVGAAAAAASKGDKQEEETAAEVKCGLDVEAVAAAAETATGGDRGDRVQSVHTHGQ